MGNKVNPVSFRLHQTKDWDSLWHNKSDFAKKFNEDILIKEFITNFFYLRNVSVSNFYINRNHKSELFIYFNIYLINNKNSSKLFQKNFRKNFYSRKKLISSSKLGGYNDRKVSFKDSSLFTKKSWRKFSPNKSINHLQLVTIRPSSNFLLNYNSFLKNYITGFKNTKKKYLSNKKKIFLSLILLSIIIYLKTNFIFYYKDLPFIEKIYIKVLLISCIKTPLN